MSQHAKALRLPVQHLQHPHCASCGAELPNFKDVQLLLNPGGLGETTLFGITYHVRCACGAKWNLRKEVEGT